MRSGAAAAAVGSLSVCTESSKGWPCPYVAGLMRRVSAILGWADPKTRPLPCIACLQAEQSIEASFLFEAEMVFTTLSSTQARPHASPIEPPAAPRLAPSCAHAFTAAAPPAAAPVCAAQPPPIALEENKTCPPSPTK